MEKNSEENDFLEHATNPNDPYNFLYLLREYRKIKKELAERNLQKLKYDMSLKFNEEQNLLQSSNADVYSKMTEIEEQMPAVMKNIRLLASEFKQNEVNKDSSKSSNTFQIEEEKIENKVVRETHSSGTQFFQLKTITDFLDIIQLLAELFQIPKEEEFVYLCNQLLDSLDVPKDYKSFGHTLNILQQKYAELNSLKEKFDKFNNMIE